MFNKKNFNFPTFYLLELKYRLAYTFYSAAVAIILSYKYKQTLIYLLIPEDVSHFITTELTEIFNTYLQICIIFSFLISFYNIIMQFYLFIRPALYKHEAGKILRFIYLTTYFYLWAYTILFPTVNQIFWQFFSEQTKNFIATHIIFEPQLKDYLEYTHKIGVILNITFFFFAFLSLGLTYLKIYKLTKHRQIVYSSNLTFTIILAPPEIMNQLFIVFNLIIFYEIQIYIRLLNKYYQKSINLEASQNLRENPIRQTKTLRIKVKNISNPVSLTDHNDNAGEWHEPK